MDNVNKTLYIPLYGKAKLSTEKIIISDKKAEEIWEKEKFPLKGKRWQECGTLQHIGIKHLG